MASPALAGMIGAPINGELGFQPGASPMKEQMIAFHDGTLMPIITAISAFVMFLLIFVMIRYNAKANPVPSKTTHNTVLEAAWTIIPVLILIWVVVPSMRILYFADRTHEAEMTLKVTGHQWYWEYDYPDHGGINFVSNLIEDDKIDPKKGQLRLLSTDNVVVLPVETNVRLLITAADVIHAWAVPSFGVKLDAVPGRLNETWVRIDKEGTFYGQCSELCGTRHGFMPIEVRAVSKAEFAKWVHAQGGKMPEELANEKGAANAAAPPASTAAPANANKAGKDKKEEEKAGEK
ncbi:MAG: cytochrome c oxidase subunit II [Alphaproteobacteria bacterium]|nr:MAG: cytochrome c oxidase subunit II [Alphaproteobacteria bacterium]